MAYPPTLVLGLGNPIMGDDGVGIAALEALSRTYIPPSHVTLADGGTWGMQLLPMIEDHRRVLFLDAVSSGRPPGSLIRIEGMDIPKRLGQGKLSPHQVDLHDILGVLAFKGALPVEMVALGIEPESVAMWCGLSPVVKDALPDLVAAALEQLDRWQGVGRESAAACRA